MWQIPTPEERIAADVDLLTQECEDPCDDLFGHLPGRTHDHTDGDTYDRFWGVGGLVMHRHEYDPSTHLLVWDLAHLGPVVPAVL